MNTADLRTAKTGGQQAVTYSLPGRKKLWSLCVRAHTRVQNNTTSPSAEPQPSFFPGCVCQSTHPLLGWTKLQFWAVTAFNRPLISSSPPHSTAQHIQHFWGRLQPLVEARRTRANNFSKVTVILCFLCLFQTCPPEIRLLSLETRLCYTTRVKISLVLCFCRSQTRKPTEHKLISFFLRIISIIQIKILEEKTHMKHAYSEGIHHSQMVAFGVLWQLLSSGICDFLFALKIRTYIIPKLTWQFSSPISGTSVQQYFARNTWKLELFQIFHRKNDNS